VDRKIARDFVAALTGSATTPMWFRLIDDHKDRLKPPAERRGSLDDDKLWFELEAFQAQGYAIFYLLNEVHQALVPDPAGPMVADINIVRIRGVVADFDHGLPEEWAYHQTPSLIVHTSPGKGQAIWLGEVPVEEFRSISERIIANYDSDKAVKNPSRVLRLPGSVHLKSTPYPVTFEGTGVPAEVQAGLPALPPPRPASSAVGTPVDPQHLVELLRHIEPGRPRADWITTIAGIRATTTTLGEGEEEWREQLAVAWSRGAYHGGPPANYTDDAAVEEVWRTMLPKEGGAGYGTLYHQATAGGFRGPSIKLPSIAENFKGIVKLPGQIHSMADTLTTPVEPIREIIPGLLERDIATFLAGAGSSMKSWLSLQWAMCVQAGVPVWERPVEQATMVLLNWENSVSVMRRRAQAIAKRLNLPKDMGGEWWDMTGMAQCLAVIGDGVELQPLYGKLMERLTGIAGHKLLLLDSTYNALRFTGNAKINDGSVMLAIGVLHQMCVDADCSIVPLWHPSQAGITRGTMDGFATSFHNTPRARISLARDSHNRDVIKLKVEKRNNAPEPKDPILLHWNDGALLPISAGTVGEQALRRLEAIYEGVVDLAEQETPMTRKKDSAPKWLLDKVELVCGERPTVRELREDLDQLSEDRRIRYRTNSHGKLAGYYPFTEEKSGE